ncbi:hypothetical protein LJC63_11215 [Ruminococcaceae bacterium OttesenSCG-928-L11]|nr:hypothetical protein [Ruminococcaceae bacterium OttesenSCG-928-L11]
MEKAYYKLIYAIYFCTLAIGGVVRLILKLFFTDHATGFAADGTPLATLLNVVLLVGLLALLAINMLYRGKDEIRLQVQTGILPVLAILTGLSIAWYVWQGLPSPLGQAPTRENAQFAQIVLYVNYGLGSLAALSFLVTGIAGFLRKTPPSILLIVPSIWQIMLLLSRYNGYYSVLYIGDYLLAILFMGFATLFYMAHGRTVCGFGRRDGRNYIISSAMGMTVCGFLLSIPNFIYMAMEGVWQPARLLSLPEVVYAFAASVYAFAFLISYTRSIHRV